MIPKVAGKGASFKGAGLYYLHDKNAGTRERVAFTHTQNLPTDDPDLAIRLMAHTAMRQTQIKAANKNAVKTGRKLQKPVYAYSLAWSPDETPTPVEMIEAGRETLDVLGLQGHEVLMVSHNDEPHPHIHVIVNRVHPETGLATGLSHDHLKLSRWAESYEKTNGKIHCQQRVENNARRRRGQFVKDLKSTPKAQFHAHRKLRLRPAFERRSSEEENLAAYHTGGRQALYDERRMHIRHALTRIRELFRPEWAALYQRQNAEKKDLERMQRSAWSRLLYWLKNRDSAERSFLGGAIKSLLSRRLLDNQLAGRHQAERTALAARTRKATLAAIKEQDRIYRRELDKLEKLQTGQTNNCKSADAGHSPKGADQAREPSDAPAHEAHETGRPGTLGEGFAKAARKRVRRRRKREERGTGHGPRDA